MNFTTIEIPAQGDMPSVKPTDVTATKRGKWWEFDLPREGRSLNIRVAPAPGLDIEPLLKGIAEDFLYIHRLETLGNDEPFRIL